MSGYFLLCSFLRVSPSASVFYSFFLLRNVDGGSYFYLTTRGDSHFLTALPHVQKRWKEEYFYIFSPQPWGFPLSWIFISPLQSFRLSDRKPEHQAQLETLNRYRFDLSYVEEAGLLSHLWFGPPGERMSRPLGITSYRASFTSLPPLLCCC